MPEETAPQEQPKQRRFVIKLVQTVPEYETVTEQYQYDADNKKQALQKAQNFIDDEKDMEGVKYRLEAEEIVEEEPAAPGSESTEQ